MRNFLFIIFILFYKSSISQLKLFCEYNPDWSYTWFHDSVELKINSNVLYSVGKNVSGQYRVMVNNLCDTVYGEIKIKKPKDKNEYNILNYGPQQCSTPFLSLFDEEWYLNLENPLSFIFFPNPTNSDINIRVYRTNSTEHSVIIQNALGQTVFGCDIKTEVKISINNLEKGIYFLTVYNETKQSTQLLKIE